MESKMSKGLNTVINSGFGVFFITIIPIISFYVGVIKDLKIDFKASKMEIAVSILVGLCIYLLLKSMDTQNKLLALKKFRDYESLSMANFYNTEIKKLNDRLLRVESANNIKTESELDEDKKRLFDLEETYKKDKIIDYNNVFKLIGEGDYGIGGNTTFYKNIGYK